MEIILFHPDAALCEALSRMVAAAPDVTVLAASYEELAESGLCREHYAAVVTPGNSFGIMDGGMDAVIERMHPGTQKRIQLFIVQMHGPEMPIGTAVMVTIKDQSIIYAPTMQGPMDIRGSDHVYRAARAAAFKAWRNGTKQLFMPLMGCGTGMMEPEEAVYQMLAGVRDSKAVTTPEELTWDHANRMHMQWHQMLRIPDDGYRWGDVVHEPVADQTDG